MKKLTYLVTGAAGFLGSHVCRGLLNRGDRVRAFVLEHDPAMEYVPKEAEIVTGDLCDPDSLSHLFAVGEEEETVVLHCASIVTVDPSYNQKVMDVNVGGTENIIAQCLAHPNCKKLVYVSSTGAIPESPKGQKIAEPDAFDPQRVEGCYSQSKAMATQRVLDAVKEKGLNASVVFPSGIMGPDDYGVGETTGTVIRIIKGEMPVGIDGSFNLADARDLAQGVILAADKGAQGGCYILGNEEVTFRDFSRIIAQASGGQPMENFLPIDRAYAMAEAMEKEAEAKGTKPLMTRFSVYNLARNNAFDSTRAKEELGYRTRSYEETMKDEIAWLIRAGKLPG